jgi:hypothetical protein
MSRRCRFAELTAVPWIARIRESPGGSIPVRAINFKNANPIKALRSLHRPGLCPAWATPTTAIRFRRKSGRAVAWPKTVQRLRLDRLPHVFQPLLNSG